MGVDKLTVFLYFYLIRSGRVPSKICKVRFDGFQTNKGTYSFYLS